MAWWLELFVTRPSDKDESEKTIRAFFRDFRYQPVEYKIVWLTRIACWVLLLGLAAAGTVIRYIEK